MKEPSFIVELHGRGGLLEKFETSYQHYREGDKISHDIGQFVVEKVYHEEGRHGFVKTVVAVRQ